MRTRIFLCVCALLAFVLVKTFPAAAASNSEQSSCLSEAKTEYQNCVSTCEQTLQVDQDTCRNINPECAGACQAGYDTCIQGPSATLQSCNGVCDSTLSAAEKTCNENYPKGSQDLTNCINSAKQTAILCRANCQVQVQPEFAQCQADFNACIKACPSASGQ